MVNQTFAFSLSISLFLSIFSYGQTSKTIAVCLQFDSLFTQKSNGRILVLNSNKKNEYNLSTKDTCVFIHINTKGKYQIIAEFENYNTYEFNFKSDTVKSNEIFFLPLKSKIINLNEVEVKPEDRISQRGDTLVIRTDGIKIKPHGNASDLLNKLPGVSVDAGGQVNVLGKNIDEVKVNGKTLFGGNSKATLEALKGEMIQQLELTDSPTGESKSLNLRIKKDKTNGIYGDLGANLGTNNTYSTTFRLNQITPKKFQNGFINTNNINEKVISQQEEFRLMMSIFNGISGSYSITELADNRSIKNIDRRFADIPILDLKQGINKTVSGGYNYSQSDDKKEVFGFVMGDYTHQNLIQKSNIIQNFSDIKQSNVENTNTSTTNGLIWSNIQGKFKVNAKNIFRFSNNININNRVFDESKLRKSINYEKQLTPTNTELKRDLLNNNKQFSTSQQFLWVHRYEKVAKLTSLYFSHFFDNYNSEMTYKNDIEINSLFNFNNNQKIEKQSVERFYDLQFLQTIPLNRKWLLETKLGLSSETNPIYQNGYQFDKSKNDYSFFRKDLSINKYKSNETQGYLLGSLFYKTSKLSIIPGIGIWQGITQRAWDSTISFKRNRFYPRVSVKYQLSDVSKFSIRLNESQQMPSALQLSVLPDSSNLQYIRSGNFALRSYKKKQIDGDFSTAFKNGINVTFNLQYQLDKNAVFYNNKLNQFGGISQETVQFGQSKQLTGLFFLFKFNRSKPYSFFSAAFLNWSQNYVLWNSQPQTFNNLFGYFVGNFKYLLSEKHTFSAELKNTMLNQRQENARANSNFRSELILKSENEWKKNLYSEFKINYIINKNLQNQSITYPIVDFSINKYVSENQKFKIVASAKNLFNVNNSFITSQTLNTQTERFTNIIPRYFMFGATFYMEKWK